MDLIPLTPAERAQYGVCRAKDKLFDAVCELWRQRQAEGLTVNDISSRIGRSPRWITRALSAPGHWTITTFGQLMEGLEGEITICALPNGIALAQVLSDRLKNKTRFLSSLTAMKRMPEFQELVELGDDTVRYILREMWLREGSTVWFLLLHDITKANPVPAHERGRVLLMRERWLSWGKEHGFL